MSTVTDWSSFSVTTVISTLSLATWTTSLGSLGRSVAAPPTWTAHWAPATPARARAMATLGVPLDKFVGPATRVPLLGFELDTVSLTIGVTPSAEH